MQELNEILANAARRIATNFFTLPIDGGAPIFLERVYCYELYHQMRRLWPRRCRFCLNGEVDKRGHQLLRTLGRGAHKVIPDLLIHGPGDMDRNHAIIEVKKFDAGLKGIRKDIATLTRFLDRDIGYERGIILIFGELLPARRQHIFDVIEQSPASTRIEFWHHRAVRRPAVRLEREMQQNSELDLAQTTFIEAIKR